MLKVRAHTCYLGKTGYSAHARSFFRELSKHVDLRVRNYTWDADPDYLNEIDLKCIDQITLRDPDGGEKEFPISHSFPNHKWENSEKYFEQDVDIVLMDMDHFYFYQNYSSKIKIAYTVWESTEIPKGFFKQLMKFDYLWVATQWHKDVIIKQGYPEFRVFVVNEGVEASLYLKEPSNKAREKFEFMFFGRWDYRKSLPEIVKAFIEAFPDNDEVELILSADNPYSVDGFNSTEERLAHYGLVDERIKVKHFLSREEYEDYIKNGHVLVTCARSEGWNIPLIEAMVAGTPVIYSNWGGQLEFANGKGNPVRVADERPASIGAELGFAGDTTGLYCEPDFEDLKRVMIDCFENWGNKKSIAREQAEEIYNQFNWEKVGRDGYETLLKVVPDKIDTSDNKNEAAVVLAHCDTREKLLSLTRCVINLKKQGYFVIVSSHISIPDYILNMCDYFICETDNPLVTKDEYSSLSNTTPVHWFNYEEYQLAYPFDFNHGFAALRLIQNGVSVAIQNGFDKTHFVNYDYIIEDPNTIPSHSEALNEYSVVSYIWNANESINSAFFSARSSDLLKSVESTKTKRDYFRFEKVVILEDFIYKCFLENNLKLEIRDPKDAIKTNLFNSFIVPTYPYIKTKSGDCAHIYLGKETDTGEYFVCVSGAENEKIEAEIIYKGEVFPVSANLYPMYFYPVSEEMLEDGFSVNVPEYDINYEYSKETKTADIKIRDRGLIISLASLELEEPEISLHFVEGPYVEIKNAPGRSFLVQFIDFNTKEIKYETVIGNNSWARCSIKYFVNWIILINDLSTGKKYEYHQDLRGQKVFICLESSSLGDTLAWFPYVEEFQKIHQCIMYVSTFKNSLFINEYPNLVFVEPGRTVHSLYAMYRIGWFYSGDNIIREMNPREFKNSPLQKTSTDILGMEFKQLVPRISIPDLPRPIESPYVCIAMHSTAQAKYWNNPTGWQEVTDWLISRGYKVVMLSLEEDGYMGNHYPKGVTLVEGERTLENAINYLNHSEMFIGIGSGLSWLSWATQTPTVIISGFSSPLTEAINDKVVRIFNSNSCNSCFNRHKLDAGDWNWCPDHKETSRRFECTKSITGKHVIEKIEEYLQKGVSEKSIDTIVDESYHLLGMIQNRPEITGAAEFFKSMNVKNFMEIGTDQGGTFAIWSKLSEDGIRISLDLPHGTYGVDTYDVNQRDAHLKSLGSNVRMIHGDSHSEEMQSLISSLLKEGELDFLFIDGDHTYEGVKKDYEDYKKYVKSGGWIGFHDIKDTEFHRNANCRVDILWNELVGEKIEFLDDTSNFGGIGFIKNE